MLKREQWIVLAVLCTPLVVQGSMITFEAFPDELIANLTSAASMRCSVFDTASLTARATSTSAVIQHITSIFVTRRNGEDLASMTQYNSAMALGDVGNLEVKGAITGMMSGEGYIELSWKEPSLMYLGEYQCAVTAVDAKGHTVVMTSGLEMSAVTPTLMDVIAEFKSKDMKQQQLMEHTTTKLKLQMEHQQHEIETQMQSLQQTINNQSTLINQLQQQYRSCTSPFVGFTAVLSAGFNPVNALTVPNNHVVKFEHVLFNEGGDYKSSTGEFVCRKPGMYTFSVHANSHSQAVCLELQVNTVLVTSLYAYDADTSDASSMSAVMHLKVGDVVRVWTLCDSQFRSNSGDHPQPNTFTGVLHQSDECREDDCHLLQRALT